MSAMRTKILLASLLTAGAVGYLAFAGVKGGWAYNVPVDQFVSDAAYHDRRVQLCGIVAASGFQLDRAHLTASFQIAGQTTTLPVIFHGSIPDMFRVGSQVVVEGKMGDNNVFMAQSLLTKCASKYDAQEPSDSQTPPATPSGHPKVEHPL